MTFMQFNAQFYWGSLFSQAHTNSLQRNVFLCVHHAINISRFPTEAWLGILTSISMSHSDTEVWITDEFTFTAFLLKDFTLRKCA